MNELNYTSLKASQHLLAAGIVLETEKVWTLVCWGRSGRIEKEPYEGENSGYAPEWKLIDRPLVPWRYQIPAAQWGDLWRELPEELDIPGCNWYMELMVNKSGDVTTACYGNDNYERWEGEQESINPCDCLAKLLIWVRGR